MIKNYCKGYFDERLSEREWMVKTQLIGRVMPVGEKEEQKLKRVKKTLTSELIEENLGLVRFVPLIGRKGWSEIKLDT